MIEFPEESALLFLVSGPAGSGKTTLCDGMLSELTPKLQRVITATTRNPREGEIHGNHYYFLSREDFEAKIKSNHFYEFAEVYGHYYGVLKEEIDLKLNQKCDLILNIDVQGAETFINKAKDKSSALYNKLVSIFIMPPSKSELRKRLEARGGNDKQDLEHRLKVAESEVQYWKHYNYCLPSLSKEEDFVCLFSCYAAEKLRVRSHT